MLFMGDAIPEFQVLKHDPVCVRVCVHVRVCCVCAQICVCVCVCAHASVYI